MYCCLFIKVTPTHPFLGVWAYAALISDPYLAVETNPDSPSTANCTRYLCHELKHPYASRAPGKCTTSEPLYSVLIFSCCHNNLPQLKTTAIYYLTVSVGRSPRAVGLRASCMDLTALKLRCQQGHMPGPCFLTGCGLEQPQRVGPPNFPTSWSLSSMVKAASKHRSSPSPASASFLLPLPLVHLFHYCLPLPLLKAHVITLGPPDNLG